MTDDRPVLCLTGGIGGAKLALGLYRVLPPDTLTVAINTGDDFTHLGLEIWPDFDTTLYTLSGLADPARGWGRAEESWRFLEALRALGADVWFQLGDQDLATHIVRTEALRCGTPPSAVAARLAASLGVRARLAPAADRPVRTIVEAEEGALAFQDYFVRRRASPRVKAIHYLGADEAAPAEALQAALTHPNLRGVVIAPSNPLLSIAPILAIAGMRAALAGARAPVIAVTPIIGGAAVKGPTAKIMAELGVEISPVPIAAGYRDILDGFMLDRVDADLAPQIRALGVECRIAQTLMQTEDDKTALARDALDFLDALGGARRP